MGQRIASHGFVVLLLTSNRPTDGPTFRSDQLIAAREWLQGQAGGTLRGILDPGRYAYSGHSFGGGGSLLAGVSGFNFMKLHNNSRGRRIMVDTRGCMHTHNGWLER